MDEIHSPAHAHKRLLTQNTDDTLVKRLIMKFSKTLTRLFDNFHKFGEGGT